MEASAAGSDTTRPLEDKNKPKSEEKLKSKDGAKTEPVKSKPSGASAQATTAREQQKPGSPYKRKRGRYNGQGERPHSAKHHSEPRDKMVGVKENEQRGGGDHAETVSSGQPTRGGRGRRRGRAGGSGVQDGSRDVADPDLKEGAGHQRNYYHRGRYRDHSGYSRDSRPGRQKYRHEVKPKLDVGGATLTSSSSTSVHDKPHRERAMDKSAQHVLQKGDSKDELKVEDIETGLPDDGTKEDSQRAKSSDREKGSSTRDKVKGRSRGATKQIRMKAGNWRDHHHDDDDDAISTVPPERDKTSQDAKILRKQLPTRSKEEQHGDSDSHAEPTVRDKKPTPDNSARTHVKKKQSQHYPQYQNQQPHRVKTKASEKFIPTVQSDELSERLTAGKYECTVCCDVVRAQEQVWSCSNCYLVFHLKCIKKWATAQVSSLEEGEAEEGWRCPCCRHPSTVIPSVYRCYCGKVTNPRRSSRAELTVPHSCGGLCLKGLATSLSSACNHKCRLPCHPGPCPPCPVTVQRACPCGRTSHQVRCSRSGDLPSCGAVCGRPLNCGRHSCQEPCHPGCCPQCSAVVEQRCHCGRAASREVCCGEVQGELSYCCHKTCNRELDCGNHLCELPCHKGECPSCDLLPAHVTVCPCGATPLSELLGEAGTRASCLDPVPTCSKTCGRPLLCGTPDAPHACSSLCHHGDCPPCDKSSLVWCNCGRTSSTLPCVTVVRGEGGDRVELRCQDICNKKKSCKRHRCNVRCCMDSAHVCELVCGKRLQCGLHSCQELCHAGHCRRCWEYSYEELRCHCGAEVLYPPIPCGCRPPPCPRPCARLHPCPHPVSHTCHPDSEQCPPCTFLTEKMCVGGHELRHNIPCHISDVSCGNPCGRALPCGVHHCLRSCHKGDCSADGGDACKQPCKERRKHCEHACGAPCHPGQPCRDTPCRAEVLVTCKCGRRKEKTLCLACGSGAMQLAFQNFKLLSSDLGSKLSNLQSGQSVKISSVTLQQTPEGRSIDCDEICAQEARNRKLASALEIDKPIISPLEPNETQYSPFLLEEARNDMSFVASVEKELKALVDSCQATSGVSRSHSFRPMKGTHRRIIHELAVHYGCDTVSYDAEPIRNVTVSVKKCRARLPALSLVRTVERERSRPPPPPVSVMAVSGSDTTHDHTPSVKDYFADDLEL